MMSTHFQRVLDTVNPTLNGPGCNTARICDWRCRGPLQDLRRCPAEGGRIAMIAMSFRLVLIGAAVSAVVPLAHAQLITHHDLSYAIAKTIAEAAIDSCKRR